MKKIIIFIFLFFIGITKTLAFELTTWDNLKFYFYSPKMLFNSSVDLYNKGDYERADFYLDMTKCSPDNEFCAKKYYNKGNINYKLGEQKTDNIEKEFYYKRALENYNESLKYIFDKDTVDNIDIVKKKIAELEEKKKEKENNKQEQNNKQKQDKKEEEKEQNKEDTQKENNSKDDIKNQEKSQENNTKNEKTSTGNTEKEQKQQVVKNGNMGLGGDKNDTSSLSESDKQELDNYYNSLKNEEKQNQQYFNKKNTSNLEENPFDSMLSPFKLFREDSFFGEDFDGGNSDNKKDW
ncbi:MAG: hypothetical protein PHR68_03665 [Candidatus Gracilibacteria bacterium]|nr:hypothetical protein [Candidatus Gracilibacteria bacterium]